MQIAIGNLSVMTTARQLADLFLPFGQVTSSRILGAGPSEYIRREGLIEMENACGRKAIMKLHQILFMNSYIDVDEVRD